MGETVVKAKNTFGEGLIMDFAPDNTLNTILTNALNATLLTYNGNELSLQNDMGNGRVETAFLPEGYVPVGSCEFGGIIYIVSYNPLDNKSQIGCFPSPERNFASDDLNNFASLVGTELVGDNGKIKLYSIKKILSSTEVNPGDKFVINATDIDKDWATQISNFNNDKYDQGIKWPKLVKISLVAIEDSGKINYLDSELQWHTRTLTNPQQTTHYWIDSNSITNSEGDLDLDTYRENISANYSVFQSKVSGKLALLVELEKINTFSCATKVIKSGASYVQNSIKYQNFDIYVTTAWEADSEEINPSGFMISNSTNTTVSILNSNYLETTNSSSDKFYNALYGYGTNNTEHFVPYNLLHTLGSTDDTTLSKFIANSYQTKSSSFKRNDIKEVLLINNKLSYKDDFPAYKLENNTTLGIPDDVINNYNKKYVMKYIGTVKVPELDFGYLGHLKFTITPCMPYGELTNLSVSNDIDFSVYGNNNVNLNVWKYKLADTQIILNWGLLALMDETTKISKIQFKFRDCLGLCAIKEITNLESYNGIFTEYLPLNNTTGYSNLNEDGSIILHITAVPVNVTPDTTSGKFLTYWIESEEDTIINSTTPGKFHYSNYNGTLDENEHIGLIDSGLIYSNYLYLVEIRIKRESDTVETLSDIVYYRWLWTNGMYDDYYTSNTSINNGYQDYNKLPLNIQFNLNAGFSGENLKDLYKIETLDINEEITALNNYKTLGSNTHYIGYKEGTNGLEIDNNSYIRLLSDIQLRNGHNCLINKTYLWSILADIAIADSNIQIPNEFTYQYSENEELAVEALKPIISNLYPSSVSEFKVTTPEEYLNFKDSYKLQFKTTPSEASSKEFIYYKSDNLAYVANKAFVSTNMKVLSDNTSGIYFNLLGIKYNKILAYKTYQTVLPILESLIANSSNLGLYNLSIDSNNNIDCKRYLCIGFGYRLTSSTDSSVGIDKESYISAIYNSDSKLIRIKTAESQKAKSSYVGNRENTIYVNQWENLSINSVANETGLKDLFVPIVFSQTVHVTEDTRYELNDLSEDSIYSISYELDTYNYYNSLYANSTYRTNHQELIGENLKIPQLSLRCWLLANNSEEWVPTILGIRVNNKLYTTLNFFRQLLIPSANNSSNYFLGDFVQFALQSEQTPKNYGLLIGSLLGLIYYQTDRTQTYYKYLNIISLNDFNEIFTASVIIDIQDLLSSNPGSDDIDYPEQLATASKECCLILLPNKMSIEDYYKILLVNNSVIDVDITNIKPVILKETKTVELSYSDPYKVNNIVDFYSKNIPILVHDFTDNDNLKEMIGEVNPGELYTISDNLVITLNQNALFKLLTTFTKDILTNENNTNNETNDETNNTDKITTLYNPFRVTNIRIYAEETENNLLLDSSILSNIIFVNGEIKFNLLDEANEGYPITWEYKDHRALRPPIDYTHLHIDGFSTINIFPYTQIG